MTQKEIAKFLSYVLDWVQGPVMVIWDGARIHNVSNTVAKFLENRSTRARVYQAARLRAGTQSGGTGVAVAQVSGHREPKLASARRTQGALA